MKPRKLVPKVSVITPSVRPKGLRLLRKTLSQQSFRDFEWIVGSPFKVGSANWVHDNFTGGFWSLNRIYNKMIREASGDLLVSWQDCTWAKPDALQKFWDIYTADKYSIVSGIGHKYEDETWKNKTWSDPRARLDQGTFYECFPNDIEWNFCSFPKKALVEVGGFDEQLDFVCYTPHEPGTRIDEMGGYKFYLDQTNESFSVEHGRLHEDWDEVYFSGRYQKHIKGLIDTGEYPVLSYLKDT